MSAAATRLSVRVVGVKLAFSLGAAALVGLLAPYFLLLTGPIAAQGAAALAAGVAAGGVTGSLVCAVRLARYRYLLRALAVGSAGVEPRDLHRLSDEPQRALACWILPSTIGIAASTIFLRPAIVDLTTGVTLSLLGAVITAAASLPLFALVRTAFLAALELAPLDAMREVVEAADRKGRLQQRISRRTLAAVTTPVVFLAIGAALIVNAHIRRADERDREETARVLARAALDTVPGLLPFAGVSQAMDAGRALGFSARKDAQHVSYTVTRGEDGFVSMLAPLDSGSAEVRFACSTIGFLSASSVIVALAAAALAAYLGMQVGGRLAHDLRDATRNVRDLGTDLVVSGNTSGTRVMRSARFRVIVKLGQAIEALAQRFRVFAKAQERAIEARKAAARMRGLFFASVSHDLKSPLNAILGFTELVRKTESLSEGQLESLRVIERRGRELLALIETILDAARVEAGQLKLVLEPIDVMTLMNDAILKARDLAGDFEHPVLIEGPKELPLLRLDRVRMPRAVATLVAYALRTAETQTLRFRAQVEGKRIRLEIELMSREFNLARLESMLDPNRDPGGTEHRGLALGLRLARAVTELHGGRVEVKTQRVGGSLSVVLPVPNLTGRALPIPMLVEG